MNKCKTCGKDIPPKRMYCSNRCKFSDPDYNSSRSPKIKNNPTIGVRCNHCDWTSTDENNLSGNLSVHIREVHNIQLDSISNHFTQFQIEKKETVKCPLCNWETVDVKNQSGSLAQHLTSDHGIQSFIKFSKEYPKLKKYFTKKIRLELPEYDKDQYGVQCKECGKWFSKLSNSHLKKHGLTPIEYRQKWLTTTMSVESSKIQSELTTIQNINGINKNIRSSYEIDFEEKLKNACIKYKSQFLLNDKRFDFLLVEHNTLIEIDGESFHPSNLSNMSITNINTKVNDIRKNKIVENSNYKLIRIRYDKDKFKFNTELELLNMIDMFKYQPDETINENTVLLNKEYLKTYIKIGGKQKLKGFMHLLPKLLRYIHPEFPYPTSNHTLDETIGLIQKMDLLELWNGNEVNGQCSHIGNGYLKSIFRSYWQSSYMNKKSPVEIWNDPKELERIISWRAGINNSNEIYDITLKNILVGISAARSTVSFFKPVLAAAIYKKFLGDKESPTVIDPCAGFGGRLLGFKSVYPNGTYIGIEPNPQTFSELEKLSENFSNIKLYNCKLEDYTGNLESDLTFTSIPYLDTEIYSNKYVQSKYEWERMVSDLINRYNNVLINISHSSYDSVKFDYTKEYRIKYGASHFSKGKTHKYELLLKI